MQQLAQKYERIQRQIRTVCARVGRSSEALLLPVTKTRTGSAIRELYNFGLRDFAENRVQELLKKKEELPADIRWHFIGHLQSNKAKAVAPAIDSIHSIDSLTTAQELSKYAAHSGRNIRALVEVNISGEAQKQGIAPANADELVTKIAETCPNLIVSGLMGMASFEEDPENTRPQFRMLRELRDKIRERHPELKSFTELSMGMSNDFEVAIEEGATIVRIGSALFSNE